MSKFHITGTPCNATKRTCPLGEGEHFATAQDAAMASVQAELGAQNAQQEAFVKEAVSENTERVRWHEQPWYRHNSEYNSSSDLTYSVGEFIDGEIQNSNLTQDEEGVLARYLLEEPDGDWDAIADSFLQRVRSEEARGTRLVSAMDVASTMGMNVYNFNSNTGRMEPHKTHAERVSEKESEVVALGKRVRASEATLQKTIAAHKRSMKSAETSINQFMRNEADKYDFPTDAEKQAIVDRTMEFQAKVVADIDRKADEVKTKVDAHNALVKSQHALVDDFKALQAERVS